MRIAIATVVAAAVLPHAPAWSDELVLLAGGASTRMTPDDPTVASGEFVARRAAVASVRYKRPLASAVGMSLDARWAQRGGGVSFRQTYGYYGDYLQLAPRLYARTRGQRAWGELTLGPAIGRRVRDRYASERLPIGDVPAFGRMRPWEASALVTAALEARAGGAVLAGAEVSYDHGFTNIHEPGDAGDAHDPHVFDFTARSRTVSVMVFLGLDLARKGRLTTR
jgi:hypothetical protein